jgi:hypothetical protein
MFMLSKFRAKKAGDVTKMRLYSLANGYLKLAIYADIGGQPGKTGGWLKSRREA